MQKSTLAHCSTGGQRIDNIEKAYRELSNCFFQNVLGSDLPRVINPENSFMTITLLAVVNEETVLDALKLPSIGGVETGSFSSDQEIAAYVLSCTDLGGIVLSATSVDYLNNNLLEVFFHRAIEGMPVPKDNLAMIKAALHEVIQNSIVHGNFELQTPELTTIDSFINFESVIKERALLPEYGQRKILMRSWHDEQGVYFSVLDEGPGYDFKRLSELNYKQANASHKKSNRGMLIITEAADTIEHSMNGRCLTMRFDFEKPITADITAEFSGSHGQTFKPNDVKSLL